MTRDKTAENKTNNDEKDKRGKLYVKQGQTTNRSKAKIIITVCYVLSGAYQLARKVKKDRQRNK